MSMKPKYDKKYLCDKCGENPKKCEAYLEEGLCVEKLDAAFFRRYLFKTEQQRFEDILAKKLEQKSVPPNNDGKVCDLCGRSNGEVNCYYGGCITHAHPSCATVGDKAITLYKQWESRREDMLLKRKTTIAYMGEPLTCFICNQPFKPGELTSACGGGSYHSFHDDEEATKEIPKTWAYNRSHPEDR